MAISMVLSCSRAGLEWTWARGTGSRRAEPVRPLSSSGVSIDMTAPSRLQIAGGGSPRSRSQNGGYGRKFRSRRGPGKRASRKSSGSDVRIHLPPTLVSFWRLPQNNQSTPAYHRRAGRGGAFLSCMRPPPKWPIFVSDNRGHSITPPGHHGGLGPEGLICSREVRGKGSILMPKHPKEPGIITK